MLRFLKIITPVECVIPNYSGYVVQPEEGELHRRLLRNKQGQQVWSVDVDNCIAMRNLQLLWDV